MFTLIKFLIIASGIYLFISGYKKHLKTRKIAGILLTIFGFFIFWFLSFWSEKMWFDATGYNHRFWTLILAKTIFTLTGGVVAALISYLLTISINSSKRVIRNVAVGLGAIVGGIWGNGNWNVFLKFWHQASTEIYEPIFELSTSFYLFTLPFLDSIQNILFIITVITLIASVLSIIGYRTHEGNIEFNNPFTDSAEKDIRAIYLNFAMLVLVVALGTYLSKYHLLYSEDGVVVGPGWTDVKIVLPAIYLMVCLEFFIVVILLIPGLRNILFKRLAKLQHQLFGTPLAKLLGLGILLIFMHLLVISIIPGLFQSYRVQPNEITFEKEYISNNIEFTRLGFNLADVQEREFAAAERFTQTMVNEHQNTFSNIRIWDWRALDAVLKQFQEIRLYYEFQDVDIDRYHIGNKYRQVMISAREMQWQNLPQKSQTFVNKRFKYTHGYGLALTTVSDFTSEGLPNLLIKDIPPKTEFESLQVTRPEIYYGELTDGYVIVNSAEEEFDYPSGDKNIYTRYAGNGGVMIDNFWRKLVYSYELGGIKLLLSSYPQEGSRIMYKREITNRVRTLAPFLTLDDDPYIVNINGEMHWIIDAYTTSTYYPYSEKFPEREYIEFKEGERQRQMYISHNRFGNINYIRNSVKVVVNTYSGEVDFYQFDDNDPLIQVWDRIFPGLIKSRDEMPDLLEQHIRYPADYLLVQGLVYAKYHMKDPEVFYNQEDLWIRATEKYYNDVVPVQPYYIMWQQPESNEPEFSLILPFTPKNRQVMIGWIAGMCDPENYGKFLAYNFPKEKRILGPQQVETKIDQDSFLSGQLSLWDQRGSRVIRGNVLAIPVENTLIYVEPIYLQAETAAYPELRLVCVMHQDNLSYAETFDEALRGIISDISAPAVTSIGQDASDTAALETDVSKMIREANTAFNAYLKATGEGSFEEASQELQRLQRILNRLSGLKESPSEGALNE